MGKKIIIMGAGIRGRRILTYFRNEGIEVLGFIDNDKNKWNTYIEGIKCYPIDFFKDVANEVVVFISPENTKEIEDSLSIIYPNIRGKKIVDIIGHLPETGGYTKLFPIGHFYNQYPLVEELEDKSGKLYDPEKEIKGINFNVERQLEMLKEMTEQYDRLLPWKNIDDPEESSLRYRYGNDSFSPGDAIGLFSMLQVIKPKRMIEVGSGWSSAVSLDTNETLMGNSIQLSFVEPYPDRLKAILKKSDNVELREENLENIEMEYFQKLDDGDILFIDSSHVSKMGSDVNYLFFDIIPSLKNGVYIHLHDVFSWFEYPMEWIKMGRVWNEQYLLRAFLQYNESFEIVYFQNMMEKKFPEQFVGFPKDKPIHGGSFWMRKIK